MTIACQFPVNNPQQLSPAEFAPYHSERRPLTDGVLMFRMIAYACACLALATLSSPATAQVPHIIETIPADGDFDVSAELTEIRVTFDQDMDPWGFSFVGGGPHFPQTTEGPRWETPRTAVLPVTLRSGWYYEVGFNEPPFTNFRSTLDDAAAPLRIHFCTSVDENDPRRLHPEQNKAAIERLRLAIEKAYSYRDRLDIDWDGLLDEHRDSLVNAPIAEAFAKRVANMLACAEDPHISLATPNMSFGTGGREVTGNFDFNGLLAAMPMLKRGNTIAAGRLTEDIGYILITTWSINDQVIESLYEVLEELIDSPGLIIDVRPNGGGDELKAQAFASCFLVEETPYATHVWRNPELEEGWSGVVTRVLVPDDDAPIYDGKVVVLMGPHCMSSNEAFLMMMGQVPDCVLIGTNSYGSSGNPKPFDLLNGVTINLPSWKAMTLEGEAFEGIGIKPDITVEATREEIRWQDPLLQKAREVIEAAIAP